MSKFKEWWHKESQKIHAAKILDINQAAFVSALCEKAWGASAKELSNTRMHLDGLTECLCYYCKQRKDGFPGRASCQR